MRIKREELDYVRQALYEGIKGREESRRKLGYSKAEEICRNTDNMVISIYGNLIKRISKELEKR